MTVPFGDLARVMDSFTGDAERMGCYVREFEDFISVVKESPEDDERISGMADEFLDKHLVELVEDFRRHIVFMVAMVKCYSAVRRSGDDLGRRLSDVSSMEVLGRSVSPKVSRMVRFLKREEVDGSNAEGGSSEG